MILDEIVTYLAANGIGTPGVNLFAGKLPPSPDACVAVFETGGMKSLKAFGTPVGNPLLEYPIIMVQVRSDSEDLANNVYPTARNKCDDVNRLLDGFGKTSLSGVWYEFIEATRPFAPFQVDEDHRHIFSCDYEVAKVPSP